MSSAKEKKLARKAKEQSLKEQRQSFMDVLKKPIAKTYVLEKSVDEAQQPSNNSDATRYREDDDETHVEVEKRADLTETTPGADKNAASHRKGQKLSWSTMKLDALETYAKDPPTALLAARVIDEHDGNAVDPHFTTLLKTMRGTVPVPAHWSTVAAFFSKQANRESASAIVPPEIEATNIREIRASTDPKTLMNINRIAFVRCFSTGTPLATKTFGVRLTVPGDVFEEGRLAAKVTFDPRKMSNELKEALGMRGTCPPPPWIYSLQHMKRLPPAYPFLRVPGLNAPIPDGAQWGGGEGMWGHAPRNDNGSPTFPGVMGDVMMAQSAANTAKRPWGSVPPPAHQADVPAAPSASSAPVVAAAAPSNAATPMAKTVPSAPAPFLPRPYQPAMTAAQRVGPVQEMEYVRSSDVVTSGLVAQGGILMPKGPDGNPLLPPRGGGPLPPPPPPPHVAGQPQLNNTTKF